MHCEFSHSLRYMLLAQCGVLWCGLGSFTGMMIE